MEEKDGLYISNIDVGEANRVLQILNPTQQQTQQDKPKANIYDEQEEDNSVNEFGGPQLIQKSLSIKDIKAAQVKAGKLERDTQKRIVFVPETKEQETQPAPVKLQVGIIRREEKKVSIVNDREMTQVKKQRAPIISNTSSPAIKSLKSIKSIRSIGNDEQFDRLSRKTRETFRSTRSSCEDYLGHLFDYYCKLSYAVGKDPTFDQISQKVRIMSITNFMVFCRDFKIRSHVDRLKLVQVFNKNSSFHKYLTPEQFHQAVEGLAEIMFGNFEEERRFGRMLIFLQIHNSYSFVRKMNQLGVVFRMKNKRGKEVRVTPKYTFKLTPNNGKTEQQIAIEVKERTAVRKIIKSEQVELFRKKKLNKIDQLYKNGAKKNKYQSNSTAKASIKPQGKQNVVYYDGTESKKCQGYYNPCELFSARSEISYGKINEMKKIQTISRLKKLQSERVYEGKTENNGPNGQPSRQMKVNDVIKLAKNTISEQNGEETLIIGEQGSIKKQNLKYGSICKNYRIFGKESLRQSQFTGEIIQTSQRNYFVSRKSKQIKLAEISVSSQIKNISQVISEAEPKPKQFLRATANVQKQNQLQINELEQMIGANEENDDQILTKHFTMERKYQQNLSRAL